MDNFQDIKKLWNVFICNINKIFSITFAITLTAAAISLFVMPQKYTASTILYVVNKENPDTNINLNDINAAQKLVNTCQVLFKSRTMLENVKSKLNLLYSDKELSGMIEISSVNSTEVLQISVESDSPQEAADIANELAKLAPEEFKRVVNSGSIEIVTPAYIPDKSSSPNTMLIICAAFAVSFIGSFFVILAAELLDTTVKREDDLSEIYGIPVLAEVADFNCKRFGG